MRRPLPVSSLGDLWSRVPPGAPVRVRDASVGERRGRFVKASQDALTIEIDLGEVIIPAERVQLVERRSYVPGHWIGMVVGGVAGFFKKHDPYNRHATCANRASSQAPPSPADCHEIPGSSVRVAERHLPLCEHPFLTLAQDFVACSEP